MSDLQVTQEVIVVLDSFHNIDLFQRGFYQLRCHVEPPSKLTSIVECEVKEETKKSKCPCLFKAYVEKYSNTGTSKTFEVYYKHEDVKIKDVFIFKVQMLIDSNKMDSQLPQKLQLILDLYFAESTRSPTTPKSLELASTQTVSLHLPGGSSYHAHRPVLFDYFHLAAVNVSVHSSVVAMRQPWSAALKALHPVWSGKLGNIRQYTYTALFGKNLQPSQSLEYMHKEHASYMHRKLCLQLLQLYETLLTYYHAAIALVPKFSKMRLSKVDVDAKLEVLNGEMNMLGTAEDIYLRVGDDLYLLSTELNMLWTQFSEQFVYENTLGKKLLSEHHLLRTGHMKEVVFTQEHPWEALCTSLELSTSQQTKMFNMIKDSLYYQLVPPVNIEVASLDGDASTMPIIFEDKYVPGGDTEDSTARRSITVQESIIEDDFVDMDVSIEDSHGKITRLSSTEDKRTSSNADEELAEDVFENGLDKNWEISQENISSLTKETDLTGPDYCSSSVEDVSCTVKENSVCFPKSANKKSTTIFYTDLNESDDIAGSDKALLLEKGEKCCEGEVVETNIDGSPPPTRPPRSKVWGCFPSKNKHSPYKVAMVQPPTYSPVPTRFSTRFQSAKENLKLNIDVPGYNYRLKAESVPVKPYFSEKLISTTENVHLVVCVHGLDGNSGDLRLVRCFLEMALPRANLEFLMSEVNQEDTFCDIDLMTQRLADEILEYIDDQGLDVVKLSFIGHSLGNIIIRNAIAHSSMFLFRNKLHTFLSLSGPHLGMQFHTSNLVSTGMWLMQKWKKCGSLVQLALNDSSDPRDTFMYRLSLTNGFQYFKNVLLVSSVQDHYVPFHSARLEMSKSVVKDNSEVGRVYKEMLDNIMNPLMAQEEVNIVKYSVYHPMPASANSFIGRAAHIAMLDSELFLEKFILVIAHPYFQ